MQIAYNLRKMTFISINATDWALTKTVIFVSNMDGRIKKWTTDVKITHLLHGNVIHSPTPLTKLDDRTFIQISRGLKRKIVEWLLNCSVFFFIFCDGSRHSEESVLHKDIWPVNAVFWFFVSMPKQPTKKKKHPNIYFVYLNEKFGFSFLPSEGQSEIYKKPLQWNGHLIWKNICFVFFLSVSGRLAGWSFVCRVMKCEPVACHLLLFVVWALFLWFLCASFGFRCLLWLDKSVNEKNVYLPKIFQRKLSFICVAAAQAKCQWYFVLRDFMFNLSLLLFFI